MAGPVNNGGSRLILLQQRPRITRVTSWAWYKVGRRLGKGLNRTILHRREVFSNLKAVHDHLPPAAREKFVKIIQRRESGIIQVRLHPELFDPEGNLPDFSWIKEKHICKLISLERLDRLATEFGEEEGVCLLLRGDATLQIVSPAEKAKATVPATIPSFVTTAEQLREGEKQQDLLVQALRRAKIPLNRNEIIGMALIDAERSLSDYPRRQRRRSIKKLQYDLLAVFDQLIKTNQLIRTVDDRYLWLEDGKRMLQEGSIIELYSKEPVKEYVSREGVEEFDLVEIRVKGINRLARLEYAQTLELNGEARVVYDVEAGEKVSRYYLSQEIDLLLGQEKLVKGREKRGKEVYVTLRARRNCWSLIYNYGAMVILRDLSDRTELNDKGWQDFKLALDKIFAFVVRNFDEEAFSLLERAKKLSRIGGTPVEVLASFLTMVSRPKLLRFISSAQKVIPAEYRTGRTDMAQVVEKFHLLSKLPFCVERDDPRYLQWYLRFFLKQTDKVPVLKLLVADALHRLKREEEVDTSKLELVYLPILDRTVEIEAAAALKDALFWARDSEKARVIQAKVADLYGMPYEHIEAQLDRYARGLEKELREKLERGDFGEELRGLRLFVLRRKKSDASIDEKIFGRRIYDDLSELWDIGGIQVVTESQILAQRVAGYVAKEYGVRKRFFEDTGRIQRLSAEECHPAALLRRGDVRGPFGQRIEFYKVGALFTDLKKPFKAEIQIHEEQMFWRYKRGASGTAVYNLQKKHEGLKFEPEPLADPMLGFEEQIEAMLDKMEREECLVAGVNLNREELTAFVRGERPGLIRSMPAGTRVAELAADRTLREKVFVPGYECAEVYRFALTNEWELALVPVLKSAQISPEYKVRSGEVVVFKTVMEEDAARQSTWAGYMLEKAVNPFACLQFRKLVDTNDQFRGAIETGRSIMREYLHGEEERVGFLEQIFKAQNFINLEDFLAAIGYGYVKRSSIQAEIKKHRITMTPEVLPGDQKTLTVSSPDAFGLLRYLLQEVITEEPRIVGGISFTIREGEETRVRVVFSFRGKMILEETAHSDLNAFIHEQREAEQRAGDEPNMYTIHLRKKGEDWNGFRALVDFLWQSKINVFEFDIDQAKEMGYVKVVLPPGMAGADFTRTLLETTELPTDEHTVVSL